MKYTIIFLLSLLCFSSPLHAQSEKFHLTAGIEYRFIPVLIPKSVRYPLEGIDPVLLDVEQHLTGLSVGYQIIRKVPRSRFHLSFRQFLKYDHLHFDADIATLRTSDLDKVFRSVKGVTTDFLLGLQYWIPIKDHFLQLELEFGVMNRGSNYMTYSSTLPLMRRFHFDAWIPSLTYRGDHFSLSLRAIWAPRHRFSAWRTYRILMPTMGIHYHLKSFGAKV